MSTRVPVDLEGLSDAASSSAVPVNVTCDWDVAGLAASVRTIMPDVEAAILVGSAVMRSHSVNDLDIITFSREIPVGTDRTMGFSHGVKPVHVVAYNPSYFDIIFDNDTLFFLFYRELRKMRVGHVLFDDGNIIKRLLATLATRFPPLEQIKPLADWLFANRTVDERDDFLLAVERLAFSWLHIAPEYRYAKPKWLLEDSQSVRSPTLTPLLSAVSQELIDLHDLHALVHRLESCGRDILSTQSGPGHHFANNLGDTRSLLASGRLLDAVWPLRMAAAMLAAARADELKLEYDGIGDIDRFHRKIADIDIELSTLLRDIFLLDRAVSDDLRTQFTSALRDFKQEWHELPQIPGPPLQHASDVSTVGSFSQSSTPAPGFVSGQGLWLINSDGTRYLDAASGTFNLPFGYCHPNITAAVTNQLSRLTHLSSALDDSSAQRLLTRLLRHAGAKFNSGWIRDCSGSTAIECAVKIAQKYTGRSDIITLYYSHHGQTLFTSAISNDSTRRHAFPAASTPTAVRVPAPYCHRCFYRQHPPECGLLCADRIADIVDHTSQGPVAAVLVEPILGNGGNITLPAGYAEKLRDYCNRSGILLIADEVQTGLGRTGEILASPSSGIDPDIIVLAKGLGGLGLPIGAVLTRKELLTLLKAEHSFTSGGNLLAIAAAHATLDLLEAPGFIEDVRRKGALLGKLLHAIAQRHLCIGDVRGRGLMWGIELDHADGGPAIDLANRAIEIAYKREHLILRSSRYGRGNVLKIRPALISTDDELHELTARLERVLAELEA